MDEQLSPEERARYARHLILPEMGEEGQKKLKKSSVIVVGAGGLGSPTLLYLAAAGVGKIGIIDDDKVDITNLQRQVIHSTAAVGSLKVESAANRIRELNPEIEVVEHNTRLDVNNALELLSDWDMIIDGTDNFPTRYTINDACEILGKPWVFGSIHRFEGQVTVFNYDDGPNYRDLFPNAPPPELAPNCAEAGVLGVLPGIVGTIQSAETIKLLLGVGDSLSGKLMVIDAKSMKTRLLKFDKSPEREPVTEMSEQLIMEACQSQEIREEPPIGQVLEITPAEFLERRSKGWNPFLLDVRGANEEAIVSLPDTDLRIEHIAVPAKSEDLPKDCDLVVYCRTGGRSDAVARWLGHSGWDRSRVWNMVGGIHLWSDQIDSTVPKY
ncbi:MAG: molybdopterin-synthase adenylyltransferase MoeB [Candidatus Thalassarchaeaceae archaeon]